MRHSIDIQRLTKLDDIQDIQTIEADVWNMNPIPIHQTYTVAQNGGIILGAYDQNRLVGFLYSFPGFKNGHPYLCSHMLGIHPDYQMTGLGERMKLRQKEEAINMGYELITWTFDPLESVNGYLNLHKLCSIGAVYLKNHYGEMNDKLNKGLPTDRFLIEWWLKSDYLKKQRSETSSAASPLLETELNRDAQPFIYRDLIETFDSSVEAWLVPIPNQFQSIKKSHAELARDWRLKTRTAFQLLLANGFVAVDFVRQKQSKTSYYIFKKRQQLSL
ncbi:GNAT family N-acetyltransferase [Tuberibacillus sp. Marseille-P3662]|uniref:GNAT family N-acetyltransferase n=1 Tax=Tuberibacillus sp. Marseille-P3662 TaxID=1965358 RepID=UPI000A1CA30E|nr:GNAT family N-acetyltransferase [Tuberibacillus sp. Marseille-P3662]